MIYSSSKLRSFVVASLLFSSTTLSALNPNEIVETTPLPTMEQHKNNFAENEIIVTFKKDIDVFETEQEKQESLFFNDNNKSKDNDFFNGIMKEFKGKFKDKLNKHLKKDTFEVKGFKKIGAMHVKSKEDSTEELFAFFQSDEMKEYVESVSKNNVMALSSTNDNYYNQLWAIENNGQEVNSKTGTKDADMNILEAWSKTKGEQSVIVAVLDTGVDYTHSDLQDNMWNGEAKHGFDFAGDNDGNNDDDPMPDEPYNEQGHYHGTHVAGTIGAVGDNGNGISGVAQHVSIMALKVFRPNGYGYTSDILEALDYVSERIEKGDNIVAINASYGGAGGNQDDAVNVAIKKLGEQGVVFCAAAGNSSKDIDAEPTYPASYDAKNIITVAASNQDDNLASFSNYGAKSVDVSAPGTNILSTYPDNKYAFMQGTSMATPNVAGSVALVASLYADSTVAERKAMILNNVDVKSSLNNKVATSGRININTALDNEQKLENTAPTAEKDSITTPYETAISIDVLRNDTDKENDTLTITETTTASNGSVKIENNQVLYTPNKEFSGTDSFDYTISDGEEKATATVTVTVEKNPNSAPIANADSVETAYETAIKIDVLGNDKDEDGDDLTIKSTTTAKNGSVKIENNQVIYTPNSEFSGTDSFDYTISDGEEEAVTTVSITVEKKKENPNSAPIANADSVETAYETAIKIDVLGNDKDEDGDTLKIDSVTNPANGLVNIENNILIYTPKNDFSGKDTFNYTITDGKETSTATVNVVVKEKLNTAPIAKNDEVTTNYETEIIIDVLTNDKDEDEDTLSIKEVTPPENGSTKITDNKIVYTPNSKFSGEDKFNYTISDGKKESTATVKVNVKEKPNTAPIAKDDQAITSQNQKVTIDVLKNDEDEENHKLTIISFSKSSNGSVKEEENGFLTYTPNKDYEGKDSFSYTVSDGKLEAKATVEVEIKKEKKNIQLPNLGGMLQERWKEINFSENLVNFTTKKGTNVNMEADENKQLKGSIKGEGKESKLTINIPNAKMKINSNGATIIEFEDKDISIEIDSKGMISPKLPSLRKALLPKEAFPLGTELLMDDKSMKFTFPLSTDIKF